MILVPQCTATRRAKTVVTTLAIYAALGFATSWAVAWALAAFVSYKNARYENDWLSRTRAHNHVHPGVGMLEGVISFGSVRRTWYLDKGMGYTSGTPLSEVLIGTSPVPPNAHFAWSIAGPTSWGSLTIPTTTEGWKDWQGIEEARGFPALCLWNQIEREWLPGRPPTAQHSIRGGFKLPPFEQPGSSLTLRALPYRPIWSGLAFNTAFYGLIWFGVIRIPRGVRRARRVNHGRCPRCAYDRRGDYTTPCPECGWIPRSMVALPRGDAA